MPIDWTPEAITAAATSTLALLTLVLALGTLFLWLATRGLVRESKNTACRQLRAYIAIDSAILESSLSAGKMVTVTIGVKNFGQTPAYKCSGSVNCAILDFEGDKPQDLPDDLDTEFIGVIQPGACLEKSRIRPAISAEEVSGLNAGTKAIWLFGQYTYAVAFDMPLRTTKFRYFLTAHIPGKISSHFGLSRYGNDAD
jgi:hypothetical protein